MQHSRDPSLFVIVLPVTVYKHDKFLVNSTLCTFSGSFSVEARKEQVESEEASLREWEKRLEDGRMRLQEGERLLNERENSLKERDEALKQINREVAEARSYIEKERVLIQKSDVDLNARAVAFSEKERVHFPRFSDESNLVLFYGNCFRLVVLVLSAQCCTTSAENFIRLCYVYNYFCNLRCSKFLISPSP